MNQHGAVILPRHDALLLEVLSFCLMALHMDVSVFSPAQEFTFKTNLGYCNDATLRIEPVEGGATK